MGEACYIVNPASNKGAGKEIAESLRRLEFEVRESSSLEDVRSIAARAVQEGFKTIVAVGGDGTVNAVVNGLAPSFSAFLGIIPLGSGNDFANGLGYDKLGQPIYLGTYSESLKNYPVRYVDLIRIDFGSKVLYVTNQFTFGFSGTIAAKVAALIKRTKGAYVRIALKSAWSAKPTEINGYYQGEVFDIYITNGKTIAGGIKIAPEADPRDGKIEGLIVPNRARPIRYFLIGLGRFGLIRSRLAEMFGVIAFQVEDAISFITTEQLLAQGDGEPFNLPAGNLKVSVLQKTLGVISPS